MLFSYYALPTEAKNLKAPINSAYSIREDVKIFLNSLRRGFAKINSAITAAAASINKHGPAIAAFTAEHQNATRRLQQSVAYSNLTSNAIRDAHDALEQSGYGFLTHFAGLKFTRSIAKIKLRGRRTFVTKKLTAITQSDAFFKVMQQLFDSHPKLARYWDAVQQGLQNHQEKKYFASSGAFLSQIEGVFTTLLECQGKVAMYHGQPHEKLPNGRIRQDKKNHLIKLKGMGDKIRISQHKPQDPVTQSVIDIYLRGDMEERNTILHGHNYRYGTPNRSTKYVLMLYILAYACSREWNQSDYIKKDGMSYDEALKEAEQLLARLRIFIT